MEVLISLVLSIIVYCVISLLIFGNIYTFIALSLTFADRLGIPFEGIVLTATVAFATLITSRTFMPWLGAVFRPPVFLAVGMLLGVFSVGTYADWKRREAIFEFQPDLELQHSFFDSIREVPREFQFYVHSAALRHCVPYIWSYSRMALVELKPDVAVNVLPADWIEKCGIKRTH
ncbi:hypothetical protein [Rhizobium lusitanum]|uniref:Uncharacterized protein n=1 Tax=Rhizobium lusitanum TaxID=293958 RepID=A0A7X0MC77_9HYPH|nr:hypothetical protein [Rhizobium lusitanum]MBB6485527.1 hypothetical protein [Rhizobium lusitanum]